MSRRSRKPAAGANPAELSPILAPQLATLVESVPRRGEWLYVVKLADRLRHGSDHIRLSQTLDGLK